MGPAMWRSRVLTRGRWDQGLVFYWVEWSEWGLGGLGRPDQQDLKAGTWEQEDTWVYLSFLLPALAWVPDVLDVPHGLLCLQS